VNVQQDIQRFVPDSGLEPHNRSLESSLLDQTLKAGEQERYCADRPVQHSLVFLIVPNAQCIPSAFSNCRLLIFERPSTRRRFALA
jgi:hypothetical protein